jgi:hypothetical protein
MNLRQQIVQDRIDDTARLLGVDADMAFLRFAHSVIVGQSIHAFDAADLIEGAQEKQIDVITIEQDNDEADVYILQVKNSEGFPSNGLVLMRNGLEWLFNKPRADIDTLSNKRFRDKILEYRSAQSGLGPSNIRIHVAFVTNGLTSTLRPTDEFLQEEKTIHDMYDNGTFATFSFKAWGADELGTRGGVNTDILRTCGSTEVSRLFWFLNNGITIVCDDCDPVTDPDNPHVKIKNMQIVNGCQTATSLALAERCGELAGDVRVLVRIYQTSDPDLISKIVLTTNNQNQISSRDLRSNDSVQIDMERRFSTYGYFYERKPRQYDGQTGIIPDRIVANEVVGQSYLAVVLGRPSDARARKYKIWGELYNQVFGGQIVEPYILAAEAYRRAGAWVRQTGYTSDADDVRRKVCNVGLFHLSRAATYLWRRDDNWRNTANLPGEVMDLQNSPRLLDSHLQEALIRIESIIKATPSFAADLDAALKSSGLDTAIGQDLHTLP